MSCAECQRAGQVSPAARVKRWLIVGAFVGVAALIAYEQLGSAQHGQQPSPPQQLAR
jgi:hypothetical protein